MNSAIVRMALFASVALSLFNPAMAENAVAASKDGADQTQIDYCRVFGNTAVEARQARQVAELMKIKAEIEERMLVLDEKTRTLNEKLEIREKIRERVSENLIKIYSNVEVEVAAQQLQKLDTETAAELLQRLNPKVSGEIISAMEVKFASAIAASMVRNAAKRAQKSENP